MSRECYRVIESPGSKIKSLEDIKFEDEDDQGLNGFEKFVAVIPISAAFSFIISAKTSSEPAIPSASATQASFPEATIIPLKRFSTDTSSFIITNIEEYPAVDSLHAFSEIKKLSSKLKSPDFIKSNAIMEVIIFVIDAG